MLKIPISSPHMTRMFGLSFCACAAPSHPRRMKLKARNLFLDITMHSSFADSRQHRIPLSNGKVGIRIRQSGYFQRHCLIGFCNFPLLFLANFGQNF